MKKLNIIWIVLCAIGLLLWGGALVVAFAYLLKGALVTGIVITIAILAVMGLLVWLMCKYCDPRKHSGEFKKSQVCHWSAFVAYFSIAIASGICVNHALSVTVTSRRNIQDKVCREVKDVYVMFKGPENERSYLNWVETEKSNMGRTLEGNDSLDSDGIDTKKTELGNKLMAGYEDLKSLACDSTNGFLGRCYYAAGKHWTWWNVVGYVAQLDSNKIYYKNQLIKMSQLVEYTKGNKESYDFKFQSGDENLCDYLTNPFRNGINFGNLLFMLIAQLLIIAIYVKSYPWGWVKGGSVDWSDVENHVYGITDESVNDNKHNYNP